MKKIIGILVVLISIGLPVFAYDIVGNSVIYHGAKANLSVTPHTVWNPVGDFEQEFTLCSKIAQSGYLFLAYGFNEPLRSGSISELVNQSYEETVVTGWDEINATHKENFTYSNVTRYRDVWVDRTQFIDQIDKGNQRFYYTNTGKLVEPGECINWKINYKTALNDYSGKWDLHVFGDTVNDYTCILDDSCPVHEILDPWFNTTFDKRRLVTCSGGTADSQKPFSLLTPNYTQGDYSSYYFANDSQIPQALNPSFNSTDSRWFIAPYQPGTDFTFYLYYDDEDDDGIEEYRDEDGSFGSNAIAFFDMNEEDGSTTIYDSTDNGHNGTATGMSILTGYADFDGTSGDKITVTDLWTNWASGQGSISWCSRVKAQATNGIIWSRAETANLDYWYLQNNGSHQWSLDTNIGQIKLHNNTDANIVGSWHYFCGVKNGGSNLMRYYFDGSLVGNQPFTATIDTTANEDMNYGNYYNGDLSSFPADVDIDYIYHWQKTLSSNEITNQSYDDPTCTFGAEESYRQAPSINTVEANDTTYPLEYDSSATYTITANVTDDSDLDTDDVLNWVNITINYPNGTALVSNTNMTQTDSQNWTYTDIFLNALGTFNVSVHAQDNSSLEDWWSNSTLLNVTDSTQPSVSSITKNDTCYETGQTINLSWTQSDNFDVDYADCVFTDPTSSNNTASSQDTNNGGVNWCQYTFDSVGSWTYWIRVNDTLDNLRIGTSSITVESATSCEEEEGGGGGGGGSTTTIFQGTQSWYVSGSWTDFVFEPGSLSCATFTVSNNKNTVGGIITDISIGGELTQISKNGTLISLNVIDPGKSEKVTLCATYLKGYCGFGSNCQVTFTVNQESQVRSVRMIDLGPFSDFFEAFLDFLNLNIPTIIPIPIHESLIGLARLIGFVSEDGQLVGFKLWFPLSIFIIIILIVITYVRGRKRIVRGY